MKHFRWLPTRIALLNYGPDIIFPAMPPGPGPTIIFTYGYIRISAKRLRCPPPSSRTALYKRDWPHNLIVQLPLAINGNFSSILRAWCAKSLILHTTCSCGAGFGSGCDFDNFGSWVGTKISIWKNGSYVWLFSPRLWKRYNFFFKYRGDHFYFFSFDFLLVCYSGCLK